VLNVSVASVCGAIMPPRFCALRIVSSYFTVSGEHLSNTSDTLSQCQVLETFSFSTSSADRLEVEKYSNLEASLSETLVCDGHYNHFRTFPHFNNIFKWPIQKNYHTTIIFAILSFLKKKSNRKKREATFIRST
jgi:hypothetical protein